MKITDVICVAEIATCMAGAIWAYGKYNFYKGRISKGAEISDKIHEMYENGYLVVKEETI